MPRLESAAERRLQRRARASQAAGGSLPRLRLRQKGRLVKEIAGAEAKIEWTVHLANRKAAWNQFDGLTPNLPLRNAGVGARNSLVIDPGPRIIAGPNKKAKFDTGMFLGIAVPLGEIRTDNRQRLLVLGGFGRPLPGTYGLSRLPTTTAGTMMCRTAL
jgi:hypothetical protein